MLSNLERTPLVLEGLLQAEQCNRRRVWIHLDRPSRRTRRRVHVEGECGRNPGAARIDELRLFRECRTRARLETVEVVVERHLARSMSGWILHNQRRVDGDQAVAADIRLHC